MHLAYIDDSEFTPDKDQQKSTHKKSQQEQLQVLCSVLVRDGVFAALEMQFSIFGLMGYPLDNVPADFEFHAHDLFHGLGFFENWHQDNRFHTFKRCMSVIANLHIPVVYGAVDKEKLAKQIYKSANPLDISFRLCIEHIQQRLKAASHWELGLLIADEFDAGKKRNLKQVFREYRKKFSVELLEGVQRQAAAAEGQKQIVNSNLLDDMYFGDSRDSIGIQAADMCAFLIRRHLAGKEDSEWLFKIIEPNISGQIYPV